MSEVCQAIIDELQEEVITMSDTAKGWGEVIAQFGSRWKSNFQMENQGPNKLWNNVSRIQRIFSIILLAMVDSDYTCVWCSVGVHGSTSDYDVIVSPLKAAVEEDTLNIGPTSSRATPRRRQTSTY